MTNKELSLSGNIIIVSSLPFPHNGVHIYSTFLEVKSFHQHINTIPPATQFK